jgi:amidohydrolase
VARILPSLKQAVGAANVIPLPLSTGAEDFAFLAQEVPGVFFYVGATPVGIDPATAPANHSPQFFVDEGALAVGTRALLQVSLDYLKSSTPR